MNRRNLLKAISLLPFFDNLYVKDFETIEQTIDRTLDSYILLCIDPIKNVKLSSGAWLNVGEKWEVRNIGDFKSSTNKCIMGYFDRKFEIFVLFDKYTGSELQKQIQKMESKDGFLNGIVYNNGTDKFGLLGFYS